jgi:hypothetical protein
VIKDDNLCSYERAIEKNRRGAGAKFADNKDKIAAMRKNRRERSNAVLTMVLRAIAILVFGLTPVTATRASDAPPDARLVIGPGSLEFPFLSGDRQRRITVWYYRPANVALDAPVVFVMHGTSRTAKNYRKYWIPESERHGFILLVPEFSREQFPGGSYSSGNVTGRDATNYPESQWTYTAIEDIFDAVRGANGFTAPTYDIYGHSAGGQFVHRLVFFKPGARYRVAVAANSGWYLMPDFGAVYPYGLSGSGIGKSQLAHALGRRVVVLLGGDDSDPDHPQLRRTPEAMRQGANRLERGHAFFERAKRAAAEMQIPFNWSIAMAPGVAHSNAQMAPYAAEYVGKRP